MEKYVHKSAILYLFAFLWLFSALAPVYARGASESDLLKADNLIEERRYDDAIQILTDYARRNPNRFEHAQIRLRRIAAIREEFNRTADNLIYTLLTDPDDSEGILRMTTRLKELESDTSPLMVSFLTRVHEIAQFNVYRNLLRNILERGRGFLDRNDSMAAFTTYTGGLGIMREHFFAANFGEAVDEEVLRETERVNSVHNTFQQISSNLGAVSLDMARAVNANNQTTVLDTTGRLTSAMSQFIELKQDLYASVNNFERVLSELRRRYPEMGDRNHLAFVTRVIYGRAGEPIQEGMLGAFDNYWINSVQPILTAIIQNAERANSAGLAAFNAGQYSNAVTALERTWDFSNLAALLFERHLALGESGRIEQIRLFDDYILHYDIHIYTTLKSITEASNHLIQAAQIAENMDTAAFTGQVSYINAAAAMSSELQIRNNIVGIRSEIDNIISSANNIDAIISEHQNTPYIKNAVSAIENINSVITAYERQAALRYYTIVNNDLKQSLTARREEMHRGRGFLDGQSRTRDDGTVIIDHYPAESLEILSAMLATLAGDLERGHSAAENYRNELPIVRNYEAIFSLHSENVELINELELLRNQGIALADNARSRAALAEAHRQDGERLFREAQIAFQTQNFDTARDRLQRASERFNSSLEAQESVSRRQAWDDQLLNLGQAITAAENEQVVADVRNMVNNARVAYFAGNFQQAEDNLLRARNRWRVTNVTENEEVVYWLGIVRGAMSARSGRVIHPTAPLYPEMSQLLSSANRNFEEGVQFINAGSRGAGLAKFDEARQQTREVRLMFPVNQEAGMLELRMERYTDPAAFNAAFTQRLRTAINGTRQRSIEAFADLLNLAEINPNYPGIRGIITQAEIDMGFRPPPPDPRDLARSRELTASASRILDDNIIALFEVALTQIDEAIALNPENVEATRVKDRLLTRANVPGGVVLSTEDEAEFQRAVRELQAGNNLMAFAIVERLMQNPRNRNIPKLVELQRRIQAVL